MDLSFVIVEYHGLDETRASVDTIFRRIRGVEFEIIVSSNSCYREDVRERIGETFPPSVFWVFNEKNLGFSGAANQGIRRSRGRYLFLLNSDVEIVSSEVKELLNFMEENPGLGVLGPLILDREGKVQDSRRRFMTPRIFLRRLFGRMAKKEKVLQEFKDYEKPGEVDWVIGAAMVIRRKALEDVGLFDEGYFMYVEDMDLCKRMWQRGYRVFYWPKFKVKYEGTRRSLPLGYRRAITFLFNKYAWIHLLSYIRFLLKFRFRRWKGSKD